jgi:hypothetical protein
MARAILAVNQRNARVTFGVKSRDRISPLCNGAKHHVYTCGVYNPSHYVGSPTEHGGEVGWNTTNTSRGQA